jgi:hypothetical protein
MRITKSPVHFVPLVKGKPEVRTAIDPVPYSDTPTFDSCVQHDNAAMAHARFLSSCLPVFGASDRTRTRVLQRRSVMHSLLLDPHPMQRVADLARRISGSYEVPLRTYRAATWQAKNSRTSNAFIAGT